MSALHVLEYNQNMTIFTSIITACWILFIAYWLISAFDVKKSITGNQYIRGLWVRIAMIVVLILLFHTETFRHYIFIYQMAYVNPLTGSIGVVLCAAGIALAIWARIHLGKNWGIPMSSKKDAELITTGPYALVRHPIYTGVLCAALGSALAEGIIWLFFFILFCAYFLWSAKIEEKIMYEQFPVEYPLYKKRTKMLIPFIL